jgi:hypothetical protein
VHPSRPRVRTRTLMARLAGGYGVRVGPCGCRAAEAPATPVSGGLPVGIIRVDRVIRAWVIEPQRLGYDPRGSGTTGSIRYPSRAIRVIRDAKPKLCHGRFRPGSPTHPRPRASGAASHKILQRPGPARHQKAGVRPRPGPCLEADPAGRRRRQWPSRRRAGPALCKVLPACGGVGGIGPRCVAAERPPRRPA